ncbi:MAG: copper resistance protein CopC [Dehalococcoidia bacterium]|nr:copper resistance protein CopC [Dehalococcoidia bacterium]
MRTRAIRPVLGRVMEMGLVATFAAISLAVPMAAEAHSEFVRANIPAGEAVRNAPERLETWFSQELFRREGANALEVVGAGGERFDDGVLVIDDADRRHVSVGLRADMPPGFYTVTWRTLSAVDGDPAEGTFVFTIDPNAPEATPEPTPALEATPAAVATGTPEASPPAAGEVAVTEFPGWAVIAAAGILAAGGAGAWAVRLDGASR